MSKRKELTEEQKKDAIRLKNIFEEKKKIAKKNGKRFSQETVASDCGWTQGGLGHYLNGKVPLNLEAAIKIASVLEVNVFEFSPTLASQIDVANYTTPKTTNPITKNYVPVKGSAQMGKDGFWVELEHEANDGYLEVSNSSNKAYAIRGVGSSMFPAIRSGWYIVFDPNRSPIAGEYVHVVLTDGQNMIKEFVSNQNGILTLISVNGMDRLSFQTKNVLVINPFIEIQPPSRLLHELPVFDSDDIGITT